MQRSARTAHTIRPSRSFSSTIQPATGQAAWQIEQANAPKHRSGSITAIVLGAFFRGPPIILVHMSRDYISGGRRTPAAWRRAVAIRPSRGGSRAHQTLAQPVDHLPIDRRQTV